MGRSAVAIFTRNRTEKNAEDYKRPGNESTTGHIRRGQAKPYSPMDSRVQNIVSTIRIQHMIVTHPHGQRVRVRHQSGWWRNFRQIQSPNQMNDEAKSKDGLKMRFEIEETKFDRYHRSMVNYRKWCIVDTITNKIISTSEGHLTIFNLQFIVCDSF